MARARDSEFGYSSRSSLFFNQSKTVLLSMYAFYEISRAALAGIEETNKIGLLVAIYFFIKHRRQHYNALSRPTLEKKQSFLQLFSSLDDVYEHHDWMVLNNARLIVFLAIADEITFDTPLLLAPKLFLYLLIAASFFKLMEQLYMGAPSTEALTAKLGAGFQPAGTEPLQPARVRKYS